MYRMTEQLIEIAVDSLLGVKTMRLYKYYRYIRQVNPHIKAKRVLEYIKGIEREHGLSVLKTG